MWLILLVVAIIYSMCAVIFESLRKPVVIILMIPISFIGVFLTFGWSDFVFDQGGSPLSRPLFAALSSTPASDQRAEQLRADVSHQHGIRLYLKAYNHKIIPIMLTIVSTVLGLVPFLYDGSEEVFWFAFAMAAISGTLFLDRALEWSIRRSSCRWVVKPATCHDTAPPSVLLLSAGVSVGGRLLVPCSSRRSTCPYRELHGNILPSCGRPRP